MFYLGSELRKNSLKKQSNIIERQNSNSQSSAFGTIVDPGDKNVTNWKDAYSDLHKSWSYQNSQIEELTNRQAYHTFIFCLLTHIL